MENQFEFRIWDDFHHRWCEPLENNGGLITNLLIAADGSIKRMLHGGKIETPGLDVKWTEQTPSWTQWILSQYTGRKDVHGQKAFSGDYISSDSLPGQDEPIEIEWSNVACDAGYYVNTKDGRMRLPAVFAIVGNKWEGVKSIPLQDVATTGSAHCSSTKHNSSCLAKAGDDEPIFVLRANDPMAPYIVRKWAAESAAHGQPHEKIIGAMNLAKEMQEWRQKKYPMVFTSPCGIEDAWIPRSMDMQIKPPTSSDKP